MMKSVAKNPYIKSVQSYQKDLKDTVEKLKVYDEKTVLTDDEKVSELAKPLELKEH